MKQKPKVRGGPLVRVIKTIRTTDTARVDKKELKIEREFAPDPKAQLTALRIALEDE